MHAISILCFGVVWSGLVWLAAIISKREEGADWSARWLVHIGLACIPVLAFGFAPLLPPLLPAMPVPAQFILPDLAPAGGGGPVMAPETRAPVDWMSLAGVGLVMLYGAVIAWKLVRLARQRLALSRIVADACPLGEAAPGVRLLITEQAMSPFAIGGRRPAVVLPRLLVSAKGMHRLAPVIGHEAAHIARRDPAIGNALAVLRVLCWPSPFVGWLIDRWRLAAELQCDRAALAGAAPKMRRRYAQLLLDAFRIAAGLSGAELAGDGAGNNATGRALPCPPAAFSTSQLKDEKMRITSIMRGGGSSRKGPGAMLRLGATAAAIGAVGLAGVMAASGTVQAAPAGGTAIVEGEISSYFGKRVNPQNRDQEHLHTGVDVKGPIGTPIHAPADGVVLEATEKYKDGYDWGKVVAIESAGGVVTVFAHLDSYSVKAGDRVTAGQKVAEMGSTGRSTGPHVHIETHVDGKVVDPLTVWAVLAK